MRALLGLLAAHVVVGSLRHPRWVFGAWCLVVACALPGILQLKVDTSTDSVLQHSDDAWAMYQRSLEWFGGDEVVVVALDLGSPVGASALADLASLSGRLEQIEGVRRVDSLSTVPFLRVGEDGSLNLEPFIARRQATAVGEGLNGQLEVLLATDRISPGLLVSEDGRTFAVNVFLEAGLNDYARVVAEIRRIVGRRAAWVSGVPVFRTDTNRRTIEEVSRFIPLTLLVLAAVLWLLFRSATAIVIPLATAAMGVVALGGAMGAFSVPFTLSTAILPTVMLALGCSYVMHLLTAAQRCARSQLEDALGAVALPVSISGVTTAIGFVAMSVVEIDAIRFVALFGAVGVICVLGATLTLAPALLSRLRLQSPSADLSSRISGPIASKLLRATAKPGIVVACWAMLLAVSAMGVGSLRVETDVTRWFARGTDVREAYEEIRSRLAGISPMNVVIRATDGSSIARPDVLRAVADFQAFLEAQPRMGRVLSLADPIGQLHAGFTGSGSRLPPRADGLVEQYLLLLESMDQLNDLVTPSREATNVMLRVDDNGSRHLLDVAAAAERWWELNGVGGFEARVTGVMFEFARAAEAIAWGQLWGLTIALGAIAVVLWLVFRSCHMVAMALVPNAVPIGVAFGWMGAIDVPLDAGTVLIGSLALGIAVDDTVHLVTAYSGLRQERGADAAIAGAVRRVLPAISYTTIAVAAGFLVLGLSGFTFIRNLGLVTAAVMVLCWLADVILLPVLLKLPRTD